MLFQCCRILSNAVFCNSVEAELDPALATDPQQMSQMIEYSQHKCGMGNELSVVAKLSLSNLSAVSVLSNADAMLSNAVAVVSNDGSVVSNAVSVLSNTVSVLSNAVSVQAIQSAQSIQYSTVQYSQYGQWRVNHSQRNIASALDTFQSLAHRYRIMIQSDSLSCGMSARAFLSASSLVRCSVSSLSTNAATTALEHSTE